MWMVIVSAASAVTLTLKQSASFCWCRVAGEWVSEWLLSLLSGM